MNNFFIIIPTYNEKANILTLVPEIFKVVPFVRILVVDDNSPDGTLDAVLKLKTKYPNLLSLKRDKKMGLASAYITGFKHAMGLGAEFLCEMDADLSHDPSILPLIIENIQKYDAVIGSRYVAGGGTKNWGFLRRFISSAGSMYAKTILGVKINDLTGGFNCYRKRVLDAIDLDTITSQGYSFQIELKYKTYKKGFKVREVPITFVDRRVGFSKMSFSIVFEAVYKVWKLRLGL